MLGKKLLFLLLVLLGTAGEACGQSEAARKELDAVYKEGVQFYHQGKFAQAIPYFEKALSLAPEAFGPDHVNTSGILNTLASCYSNERQFAKAEKCLRACLHIRETRLGPNHNLVSQATNNLAIALEELGHFEEAEKLFRRNLEALQAAGGKPDSKLASTMNNLASLYQTTGRYLEAEVLLRKSLEINETLLGKDHPGLSYSLNNLGYIYRLLNRYEEAAELFRRNLKILESKWGKEDYRLSQALNNLGLVCQDMGNYEEAETLSRRSLRIREQHWGPDHPEVAIPLNNLALTVQSLGRLQEAEPLLRRCLQIREARLDPNDLELASTISNLGGLYESLGRLPEAEKLLLRGLRIRENRLGKNHPLVAASLVNLANNYLAQNRLVEAETFFLRALDVQEATLGKDHLDVANTLNSLGLLAKNRGQLERAESLYLRVLKIQEGKLDKNHRHLIAALNNLGTVYMEVGRYKEAEVLFRDCLEREASRKNKDFHIALTQRNLSRVYHNTGRSDLAWKMMDQSLHLDQLQLESIFAFSSESAMHAFQKTRNGVFPSLITLTASTETPGDWLTTSLTWTFRLKGFMLDSLCRYRQAQHLLSPQEELGKTAVRYRQVKQLLADAALKPPKGLGEEAVKKQLAQWHQEAEDLEVELTRALASKITPTTPDEITTAAVQRQLAPGSALVEFVRVPIADLKTDGWNAPHYFAFVLTAGKEPPQFLDLGLAQDLDKRVEAIRKEFADFQEKLRECESVEEMQALEKAQEKQFLKVSAALHEQLMAPLQKALGQAKLLYLAADGDLNRLPFEALVDGNGKYLVENYRFAYLSSGRDLLRKPAPPGKGTVVLAGPDFKLAAEERKTLVGKFLGSLQNPGPKEEVALRSLPTKELRSMGWKPLPGAAAEARDIQKSLQNTAYSPVQTFVGPEALEEVLKSLPAPRILHLATHGFFLDYNAAAAAPAEEGAGAGWVRSRLKQLDNPLLRSGIVLAGANTIGDKDSVQVEDGWVTAEEIALLNLRGTELVVLSACQTGLGDLKTGEGVYGLRRAFLYAGARTLLTSLFEVPDSETRELMGRFYGELKQGSGKLTALHAAQRGLIEQRRQSHGAAHPFFWASFVLVGDPE